MWEAIALALLVSVISPALLSWLQSRSAAKAKEAENAARKSEKLEDNARADFLATRIEATLAAADQAKVADATRIAGEKLDVVVRELGALRTSVDELRAAGGGPGAPR